MNGRRHAGGSPLDRRRAGVVLHPTSLPGGPSNGDLGHDAYRFVDFLSAAGFSVWQTLPLGPTHSDLSPYGAQSVHAGNEHLINLDLLREQGLVAADAGPASGETGGQYRRRRLGEACEAFLHRGDPELRGAYTDFVARHAYWLEDYALFRTLRRAYRGLSWWRWPAELRAREPRALVQAGSRHAREMEQARFDQFLFFRQWCALKDHANRAGVLMFGDLPLFVSGDSADVWSHREYFRLNDAGQPMVVAGVPPDYFSATGQRWGNPHYDWDRMHADGYRWWVERVGTQLEQFDLFRIDHFRGLESFWEIDASEETAIHGRWVKAPGDDLLQTLLNVYARLPLVAEDLGIITPEVEALRDKFGLPGMKILQFAFGGGADNPYLPHNHPVNAVVYTGTHDNNTTLGWFGELDAEARLQVLDYLGCTQDAMPGALSRAAFASVARLAVVPMQDILRLGGDQRMNAPGTSGGKNWRWRFNWEQVGPELVPWCRRLLELYGRV